MSSRPATSHDDDVDSEEAPRRPGRRRPDPRHGRRRPAARRRLDRRGARNRQLRRRRHVRRRRGSVRFRPLEYAAGSLAEHLLDQLHGASGAGGDACAPDRGDARRDRLSERAARRHRRGGPASRSSGSSKRWRWSRISIRRGRRAHAGRMPRAAGQGRRPLRSGDGAADRQSRASFQGPHRRPQAHLRGRRRGPCRHGPRASRLRSQAWLPVCGRRRGGRDAGRVRAPHPRRLFDRAEPGDLAAACWSTGAIIRS